MKLKQALVLGLSTAVLAIPVFAADEATDATRLSSTVNADQKASVPAKKEDFHKKGHKKYLNKDIVDAKKMEHADLK